MQTNLSERIAEDIRNKILDRTYPPSTRLPNEYELAEKYDVCRYTIREAIKKLVAIGLVKVERGKGTFVNETGISSYFEPMIEKLVLIEQDAKEIFEARIAIEVKTAALAAQNATKDEIAGMRKLYDRMNEMLAAEDFAEVNRLDLSLHETIASAGKNHILIEILKILYDMITYALEQIPISQEKFIYSMQGHERILQAIEAKDAEKASREMFDHLSFCERLVRKQ